MPEAIRTPPHPQVETPRHDAQAEEEVSLVMQAIRAVRNTRAQLRIPANQRLEALIETNGLQQTIEEEAEVIRVLSRVEPLRIINSNAGTDGLSSAITLVVSPLVVRLSLEGVVDLSAEQQRLQAELESARQNLQRVNQLVSNPEFRAKAKPEVVENEEERFRSLTEQTQRLEEILGQLGR